MLKKLHITKCLLHYPADRFRQRANGHDAILEQVSLAIVLQRVPSVPSSHQHRDRSGLLKNHVKYLANTKYLAHRVPLFLDFGPKNCHMGLLQCNRR